MSDLPPILHYADIEAEIASEHYFTAMEGVIGGEMAEGQAIGDIQNHQALGLLTICALVFKNGVAVSASTFGQAEGFYQEKGRAVARHKAIRALFMKRQVRELLGMNHDSSGTAPSTQPEQTP